MSHSRDVKHGLLVWTAYQQQTFVSHSSRG